MYLKPSPGRSVPDIERGGLLAAEGRKVTPSTYWHRRQEDGDVTEITQEEHEALVAAKAEADAKAAASAQAAAEALEVAGKPAADTVQTSARSPTAKAAR